MIPAGRKIEYREHIGSLARACEHCRGAAFKCGDLGRNEIVGGVLKSGIEITACLKIKEFSHILAGVVLESGALDDGELPGL